MKRAGGTNDVDCGKAEGVQGCVKRKNCQNPMISFIMNWKINPKRIRKREGNVPGGGRTRKKEREVKMYTECLFNMFIAEEYTQRLSLAETRIGTEVVREGNASEQIL